MSKSSKKNPITSFSSILQTIKKMGGGVEVEENFRKPVGKASNDGKLKSYESRHQNVTIANIDHLHLHKTVTYTQLIQISSQLSR